MHDSRLRSINDKHPSILGKPEKMASDCSMGATESGFHSLVMAVDFRLSSFKFCSLLISSGMAEKITLNVAWMLQIAGSYSPVMAVPARLRTFKFCSLEIESGTAVRG